MVAFAPLSRDGKGIGGQVLNNKYWNAMDAQLPDLIPQFLLVECLHHQSRYNRAAFVDYTEVLERKVQESTVPSASRPMFSEAFCPTSRIPLGSALTILPDRLYRIDKDAR